MNPLIISALISGGTNLLGQLLGKNKTDTSKPTYTEGPWSQQYQDISAGMGANLPGLQGQINNLMSTNGSDPNAAMNSFLAQMPNISNATGQMTQDMTNQYMPLMQQMISQGMGQTANSFAPNSKYSGALMQALSNTSGNVANQFGAKMADTQASYNNNLMSSTANYYDPRNTTANLSSLMGLLNGTYGAQADLAKGRYAENTQMANNTGLKAQGIGNSLGNLFSKINPSGITDLFSGLFGGGNKGTVNASTNTTLPQAANYADIFNPTSNSSLANMLFNSGAFG
jgi:hypothetical protein